MTHKRLHRIGLKLAWGSPVPFVVGFVLTFVLGNTGPLIVGVGVFFLMVFGAAGIALYCDAASKRVYEENVRAVTEGREPDMRWWQ